MAIQTKPLAVGGVVLGGSAAAVGGTAVATKQTIGDKLGDNLLPLIKVDEEWKLKVVEAKKNKDLKEILFKDTGDEKERQSLHKWCQERLNDSYGSALSSKSDELLRQVIDLCVYKIEDKLKETSRNLNVENATDEATWKERATLLKNSSETNDVFSSIKKEIKTPNTDWNKLRDWCKDIYKRGFKGSEDVVWLASKYCSKATIQEKLNGTELIVHSDLVSEWTAKVTEAKKTGSGEGIKDATLKSSLSPESGTNEILQKWCQEQYVKSHDSKVKGSETDNLLDEVKKFCTLTIKEKITSGKAFETWTNQDDRWKTNAKTLNTHATSTNPNPALTDSLKEVQKENDGEGKKWQELRAWCKETYGKPYRGVNDDTFKLADKFCKKS